jgi:hypothetical protein
MRARPPGVDMSTSVHLWDLGRLQIETPHDNPHPAHLAEQWANPRSK